MIELYKKIEKEPAITCPAYKTDKTCKDCQYSINDSLCNHIERQVDYLRANGVVAPPCKVGDTVYSYNSDFGVILPYFVENLTIAYWEENEFCYTYEANCTNENELIDSIDFDCEDIGKTVFLTEEEAERALKGAKE